MYNVVKRWRYKMDYGEIGKRLKTERLRRNMSQQDLSYEIDYSVPHISHVENGTTKLSVDFLVKAANALHVSADRLLRDNLEEVDENYQIEIMELLHDCNRQEMKILSRMIEDMKDNLRDNIN